MKPAAFRYFRARDAAHAIALIGEAGEDARFLAGGQSLVPMMNFRIARPAALVDLRDCADLSYVRLEEGRLRIGAMARQADLERHPLVLRHAPLLAEALAHAGPLPVRNRATVGGSLANAYPYAQPPCAAVCLDAHVVLEGAKGRRTVAAEAFFLSAMVTAAQPGELLRELVVPCAPAGSRHVFREAGNHAGGTAQAVVCGFASADGDARIVVSGLEDRPVRLGVPIERHLENASPLVRNVAMDVAAAL